MPRRPTDRLRRALVRAVVSIALVAGACTGDDDQSESVPSTVPEVRTLLRIAIDEWANCLNPLTCDTTAARHTVFAHVLPRLMETDVAGFFVPSPVLVAAPTVDADGKHLTYRLDPNARWSDGRPITSTDVRITWQAIMATPGTDRAGYELITDVDDRDPHVAIIRLAEPYADWQELFGGDGGWLVQSDGIGPGLDLSDRFLTELPFSAGPFRLADWDLQSAVLVANDDYWVDDRVPLVSQVQLNYVPDGSIASLADGVPIAAQRQGGPVLPLDADVEVQRRLETTVVGLWFDQRSPVLADVNTRRSLVAAVDRQGLVADSSSLDDPLPLLQCAGWLPDIGRWCDDTDFPLSEQSTDLGAFALLAAGWTPGADGVLVRGGTRLAFPITHDSSDGRATQIATQLHELLADIGIDAPVQTLPIEVWRSRPADGIDAGIGVYAVDVGVSPRVDDLYGCGRIGPDGGGGNPIAWCDQVVDEAATAFVTAMSVAEQLELARVIGDRVADQVPWLPLVQGSSTLFIRADRAVVPVRSPLGDGPLGALYDFSVETS